jgi:hypothetical protein
MLYTSNFLIEIIVNEGFVPFYVEEGKASYLPLKFQLYEYSIINDIL